MTLYMKVTHDRYELPVAVADSPRELAKMLGTTANCVRSCICHKQKGWCKVVIKDDLKERKT